MLTETEFNDLAGRYADMIFRISYGYLKHQADAEDVTQTVLIRLFQSENDFTSEDHRKNWLIRVTINECKKQFRLPWRKMEDLDVYAETLKQSAQEDKYLFESIMKLETKYRVVILLFYYEGYQTDEIATMLKEQPSTVRTRLARARKKLKKILEEEQS